MSKYVCKRSIESTDFLCLFEGASRVLVKRVINATPLITPRLERHPGSSPWQKRLLKWLQRGYTPKAIIMGLNLHLFIASLQDETPHALNMHW